MRLEAFYIIDGQKNTHHVYTKQTPSMELLQKLYIIRYIDIMTYITFKNQDSIFPFLRYLIVS